MIIIFFKMSPYQCNKTISHDGTGSLTELNSVLIEPFFYSHVYVQDRNKRFFHQHLNLPGLQQKLDRMLCRFCSQQGLVANVMEFQLFFNPWINFRIPFLYSPTTSREPLIQINHNPYFLFYFTLFPPSSPR